LRLDLLAALAQRLAGLQIDMLELSNT